MPTIDHATDDRAHEKSAAVPRLTVLLPTVPSLHLLPIDKRNLLIHLKGVNFIFFSVICYPPAHQSALYSLPEITYSVDLIYFFKFLKEKFRATQQYRSSKRYLLSTVERAGVSTSSQLPHWHLANTGNQLLARTARVTITTRARALWLSPATPACAEAHARLNAHQKTIDLQ